MMEESTETQKNGIPTGAIIVATMTIAVVGTLIFAYAGKGNAHQKPVISRYGMIRDFSLIDHHNQPYGIKNVEGKVWVANFIFTSCATECPLLSRRMQDIQETFKNDPRVELVSISVDPRTDNPERLAKYAEAFNAGEKWAFLTGETKEIERLSTKGFMVTMPGDAPKASAVRKTRELLHSQKIAVVDQLGVVRYFASGMDPKAAKDIAEVVRTLLTAE